MNRAGDWLRQAENDYLWLEKTLKTKHYSQACFVAQQIGENALKALAYLRGFEQIKSHSMKEIAQALEIDGEIERIAKRLDLYYISARYPDAFPAGAPYEYFTEEQATEAVRFSRIVLDKIQQEFSHGA